MVGLLITFLLICVIGWAIRAILAATGVGDPIATVVWVIFVIVVVFWLVSAAGAGGGVVPSLRLN